MRILSIFITGAVLLATGVLSLTWVGQPTIDTVQPMSVRVSSVPPKRVQTSSSSRSGGRYSSGGGGFSSGK